MNQNDIKRAITVSLLTALIIGGSGYFLTSYAGTAVSEIKLQDLETNSKHNTEMINVVQNRMAVTEQITKETAQNIRDLTKVVKEVNDSVNDLRVITSKHDALIENTLNRLGD